MNGKLNGSCSAGRPRRTRRSSCPGCGDRPAAWSEPASINAAFGLTGAVAVVDAPADRVVLLVAGAGQSLRADTIPVGRNILNVIPSPKGNKLFVLSAGHRAKIGDHEADEKPSLTVIEPARLPPALCARVADRPAGRPGHRPIEERWAIIYAATGANQAFVQNPNELVFLDLTQPPEPPCCASTRCTASAAVPRGSRSRARWRCPAARGGC